MLGILLSNKQKDLYLSIYNALKEEMLNYYNTHKNKSFCVLLSGGYDSRFVLYLCLELGIPISACYTFVIPNHVSTDVKFAEKVCECEHIKFHKVVLPDNEESILDTLNLLASKYQCRKKTEFECSLPMYYVFNEIKEDVILFGNCSDNYFALDGDYGRHFSNLEDGLTLYKHKIFSESNIDQQLQRNILCDDYNKLAFDVFNTPRVYDAFSNTTWEELNKPHKKGALYYAFKDKYDLIPPYKSNYQCGDSNIREYCANIVLNSKYNVGNYKSATGCYNEIVRNLKTKKGLF